MDIQISFQKKQFNKSTENYLCSRLDSDVDQHLINNLRSLASCEVKKLKSADANELFTPISLTNTINISTNLNSTSTDNERGNDGDADLDILPQRPSIRPLYCTKF